MKRQFKFGNEYVIPSHILVWHVFAYPCWDKLIHVSKKGTAYYSRHLLIIFRFTLPTLFNRVIHLKEHLVYALTLLNTCLINTSECIQRCWHFQNVAQNLLKHVRLTPDFGACQSDARWSFWHHNYYILLARLPLVILFYRYMHDMQPK